MTLEWIKQLIEVDRSIILSEQVHLLKQVIDDLTEEREAKLAQLIGQLGGNSHD